MTAKPTDPLDEGMEAWGALTYERYTALVAVARAARYFLTQTDATRRGTVVRDLDEAHEALRAALARLRGG